MPNLNYFLSSDTWDDTEVNAIQRVIESNRYTLGPEVKKYEKEFAEFMGAKHAVMTNSGSSANLITLQTLALMMKKRGDTRNEIIVPAVSWSTTFFPVHQAGFTLKFVDVEYQSFQIDPLKVAAAINENTAAVFAVNLLGSGSDLRSLKLLCEQNNVVLLEDNCESLGAKIGGQQCGTHGAMGTFSFFFSHHLQTMEGGMVLTNDDETVDYLRSLRAHGWVRDMEYGTFTKSEDPFMDSFHFVTPGYCVRPLEMSGAVGQAQLAKWPGMLSVRRANARVAQEAFADAENILLQQEKGESSWFGFGFILINKLHGRRKEVIQLLEENGVECRPIVAGNFQRNPVIEQLNCIPCDAPNADYIHENGFFIGNDCRDLTSEIKAVAKLIKEL